ncbi:MFS transporter [Pseudomonas sp. KFB-139]|uniref:MFS transporter n=1 Tax=Pseudomonas serbiensis TaxID=3064350 RepID=A0ABT9CI88_9PSED|nr:MFS transporter [Pseudomonas sp. KFB-138]MDO7925201.1 MFS transporter [Pseudomonas sp. KFB-138]
MRQKTPSPPQSIKIDRLFLLALSMAVFFVGVTEFMLSSMLGPLAQAFHTSTSGAAWLISSYALSFAIAAPLLGYFSDRMQRRKLLLFALILFAVDTMAIVVAPTLEIAIVLRVIGGIASAIIIPTTFAIVADAISPEKQSGAMGKVMLGMTLGIAVGPALAGVLADFLGWAAPFVMVSCGCILVFLIARQRLPMQPVIPRVEGHALGWCKRWYILRPLIAKGAWNGTGVAGLLLSGEVLRQRYGFSSAQIGISIAAFGVGLAVGNIAAGLLRSYMRRDEDMLLLVLVILVLSMSTFMLLPLPLPVALFCLGAWGAALGLGAPAGTVVLASRSGPDKGVVLSFAETFNNIAILASVPLAARLLEVNGPAATMWVLGVGLSIGAWLIVLDWFATRKAGLGDQWSSEST